MLYSGSVAVNLLNGKRFCLQYLPEALFDVGAKVDVLHEHGVHARLGESCEEGVQSLAIVAEVGQKRPDKGVGSDPLSVELSERTEHYEHFGDVPCFVLSTAVADSSCVEATGTHDAQAALS